MTQVQQNKRHEYSAFFSKMLFNNSDWKGYFEPLVQLIKPKWSQRYTRAQVVNCRQENDRVFTLVLSPMESWNDKKRFAAGQHIALWVEQEGRFVSRYFSVSSSPYYFAKTGLIELTIQSQYEGKVTPWLKSNLASGDVVGISDPMGEFSCIGRKQSVLFIAAGSGITPFRSMLQEIKAQKEGVQVTMLYYGRGKDGHVFRKELEQACKESPSIKIHFIDTKNQQRISQSDVLTYCSDISERDVYICGPQEFMHSTKTILDTLDVPSNRQFTEQFQMVSRPKNLKEGRIILGRSNQHSQPIQDKTLLEVAEDLGASPNAGCRMGICHQCKCNKKSGSVMNVLTGEISSSAEEIVQLCVSMPIGDVVLDL